MGCVAGASSLQCDSAVHPPPRPAADPSAEQRSVPTLAAQLRSRSAASASMSHAAQSRPGCLPTLWLLSLRLWMRRRPSAGISGYGLVLGQFARPLAGSGDVMAHARECIILCMRVFSLGHQDLVPRALRAKQIACRQFGRPLAGSSCSSAHRRGRIIRRMPIFGFGQTRLGVSCGSREVDRGAFNTNAAQPGARADPLRQAAPGRFRVLRPFSFRGQSRPASAGSSALR